MILSLVNFEYMIYSLWICSCNKVTVRGKTSKLDLYRHKKTHKRTRHRFLQKQEFLTPKPIHSGRVPKPKSINFSARRMEVISHLKLFIRSILQKHYLAKDGGYPVRHFLAIKSQKTDSNSFYFSNFFIRFIDICDNFTVIRYLFFCLSLL